MLLNGKTSVVLTGDVFKGCVIIKDGVRGQSFIGAFDADSLKRTDITVLQNKRERRGHKLKAVNTCCAF